MLATKNDGKVVLKVGEVIVINGNLDIMEHIVTINYDPMVKTNILSIKILKWIYY